VDGKELDKMEATSTLTYSSPKAGAQAGMFQISKGNLTADTAKATYWFDRQAGRLARMERQLSVKGTLTASVMGQEMPIGMEGDQTWKSRVTDKAPADK
jgi:hypothetical protein